MGNTRVSAEWGSAGCKQITMTLPVLQNSRRRPQEASLHQPLRVFDGRSSKSRVARCNMSNAACRTSISPILHSIAYFCCSRATSSYQPFLKLSASELLASRPMHCPRFLTEGFFLLFVTLKLQLLAERRVTCRPQGHKIVRG